MCAFQGSLSFLLWGGGLSNDIILWARMSATGPGVFFLPRGHPPFQFLRWEVTIYVAHTHTHTWGLILLYMG